MDTNKLYLSTTASDAPEVARKYGLGIEIAEYCTAWNMEEAFLPTDRSLREKLAGIENRLLHAPFNELFPCAIDPKARALAADRYRQAIALAKDHGAAKVVIHGGYNPWIYYPVWYVEQSILFWREFLKEDPGVEIVLENVLETDPRWLTDIITGTGSHRLKLCLDIGHVNAYSDLPVTDWLERWAPHISHFHIHNNDASRDAHSPLTEGTIPMKALLEHAFRLCPNATFTLELMEAEASVCWLQENHLI